MAQMFIGRGPNWNHPVAQAKMRKVEHTTSRRRARQFVRVKWKILFNRMEAQHARQKIRSEIRLSRFPNGLRA